MGWGKIKKSVRKFTKKQAVPAVKKFAKAQINKHGDKMRKFGVKAVSGAVGAGVTAVTGNPGAGAMAAAASRKIADKQGRRLQARAEKWSGKR